MGVAPQDVCVKGDSQIGILRIVVSSSVIGNQHGRRYARVKAEKPCDFMQNLRLILVSGRDFPGCKKGLCIPVRHFCAAFVDYLFIFLFYFHKDLRVFRRNPVCAQSELFFIDGFIDGTPDEQGGWRIEIQVENGTFLMAVAMGVFPYRADDLVVLPLCEQILLFRSFKYGLIWTAH